MSKGVSGGPRGTQGEPKGVPRGVKGSRGRLGRRPKTGPKTEAAVSVQEGRFGVGFGECGGYAEPGGGVRGGKPPLDLDLDLESKF